jgi:hypothetical protein
MNRYKASPDATVGSQLQWKSFFEQVMEKVNTIEKLIHTEYVIMVNKLKESKQLNYVNPDNGMVMYFSKAFALNVSQGNVNFTGNMEKIKYALMESSSSSGGREGNELQPCIVQQDKAIIEKLRDLLSRPKKEDKKKTNDKRKISEDEGKDGVANRKERGDRKDGDAKSKEGGQEEREGEDGVANRKEAGYRKAEDGKSKEGGQEEREGEDGVANRKEAGYRKAGEDGSAKNKEEKEGKDGSGKSKGELGADVNEGKDRGIKCKEGQGAHGQSASISKGITLLSVIRNFLYMFATNSSEGGIVKVGFSTSTVQSHVVLIRRTCIVDRYCYMQFGKCTRVKLKELEAIILLKLKEQGLGIPDEELVDRARGAKCELFTRFRSKVKTLKYPYTLQSENDLNDILYGEDMWDAIFEVVYKEIFKSKLKDNLINTKVFARNKSQLSTSSTSQQSENVTSSAVFAECPILMNDLINEKKAVGETKKGRPKNPMRLPKIRRKKATKKKSESESEVDSDSEVKSESESEVENEVESESEKHSKGEDQSGNKEGISTIENKKATAKGETKEPIETRKKKAVKRRKNAVQREGRSISRGEVVTMNCDPWERIQVLEAVSKFSKLNKNLHMTKTVIVGVDDALNCAQLIIRIFEKFPFSIITIIERDDDQIINLRRMLWCKMAELMTFLSIKKRLIFSKVCLIRTDFVHNYGLEGYKHMFVLSSGKIKRFFNHLIWFSAIYFLFDDLGLPHIVYFKIALIILSYDITYVCGYKNGIDNINNYIKYAGAEASMSDIASLGDHEIPDIASRGDHKKKRVIVSDDNDAADTQKYFTSLAL